MWGYLAIHSKRWDYRPPSEAVTALISYLQSQGIIGDRQTDQEDEYAVGLRCEELLAIDADSVEIRSTPHLQIACGPLDVECTHCGTEIDEWSDLFSQFFETEQEPIHQCATCGTRTPITQLEYHPDAGFGYFMMTFTGSNDAPNTDSFIWTEMERILGTELTHSSYTM